VGRPSPLTPSPQVERPGPYGRNARERGDSISEVGELEGDAEVAFLQLGDDGLEVVALLALTAQLIALGLALDALEAELLDEGVQLRAPCRRDADVRVATWRTVPPAASSILPNSSP
jgi:hypothetical protein